MEELSLEEFFKGQKPVTCWACKLVKVYNRPDLLEQAIAHLNRKRPMWVIKNWLTSLNIDIGDDVQIATLSSQLSYHKQGLHG